MLLLCGNLHASSTASYFEACNNSVSVVLDASCSKKIDPDMVLESVQQNATYTIRVFDGNFEDTPAMRDVINEVGRFPYEASGAFGKCTGYIEASDNTSPEFTSTPQMVISNLGCDELADFYQNPDSVEYPVAEDACDGLTDVSVVEQLSLARTCNEPDTLRRIFTTQDNSGNKNSFIQTLLFQPVIMTAGNTTIDNLDKLQIACDDPAIGANGFLLPEKAGYPTIAGVEIVDQLCDYEVTYTDDFLIELCQGQFKQVRTWMVRSLCDNEMLTLEQEVTFGDYTAPAFEMPVSPEANDNGVLLVSANGFECKSTFDVPAPQNITVGCDGLVSWTATISTQGGELFGVYSNTNTLVTNLPLLDSNRDDIPEAYKITYCVESLCNGTVCADYDLVVADLVKPVAIINDQLNVGIGSGYGRINKEDIDEGSWDNCGLQGTYVRRMVPESCVEDLRESGITVDYDEDAAAYFTTWGDFIPVSCCDVEAGSVMISLKAVDFQGLETIVMGEATVEDKSAPICIAPATVNPIDCQDPITFQDELDLDDLTNRFGTATGDDNCLNSLTIVENPAQFIEDVCGAGRIERSFYVVDAAGNQSTNTCTQVIEIESFSDYYIEFPRDFTSFDCEMPEADTLRVGSLGCELLATRIDTAEFASAELGACFKYEVTYTVIDWCTYENKIYTVDRSYSNGGELPIVLTRKPELNSNGYNVTIDNDFDASNGIQTELNELDPAFVGKGGWSYTQIIKIVDETAPDVRFPSRIEPFCIDNVDDCKARVVIPFSIEDFCSLNNFRIFVYYDEDGDGIPDVELNIEEVIMGRPPKQFIEQRVDIGIHGYYIEVRDGCGNVGTAYTQFEVIDCKAPAPVCLSDVTAELMMGTGQDEDGDGDIDAAFNTVSVDDMLRTISADPCEGNVSYGIVRVGEFPTEANQEIVVTCDDPAVLPVRIYTWDDRINPNAVQPDGSIGGNNYGYCEVVIQVQDNNNLCGNPITDVVDLSGLVRSIYGNPIQDVQINYIDNQQETYEMTGFYGGFKFFDIPAGRSIQLVPERTQFDLDGVSTYDLVLIARHVLNINKIDNPYGLLAADFDRSGSIRLADILAVRNFILGVSNSQQEDSGWDFILETHEFATPQEALKYEFPTQFSMDELMIDYAEANFIGVKKGDVDLSVGNSISQRSSAYGLMIQDQILVPGERYQIPVHASNTKQVLGAQFELVAEASSGVNSFEVKAGQIDSRSIVQNADYSARIAFMSSDLENGSTFELQSPLVTIEVSVNQTVKLSDLISISNQSLQSELVDTDMVTEGINLQYESDASITNLESFPNPFNGSTQLKFGLDQTSDLELRVYNLRGQLVFERSIEGQQGANAVRILDTDLEEAGMYIATLIEGQREVGTVKLIKR